MVAKAFFTGSNFCGFSSLVKTKKSSLRRLYFIKRIEYTENKKPSKTDGFTKNLRDKILFFLTIFSYLRKTKRFFEMAKQSRV